MPVRGAMPPQWLSILGVALCLVISAVAVVPGSVPAVTWSAAPAEGPSPVRSSSVPREALSAVGSPAAAAAPTFVPESSLVYALDDARTIPFVSLDLLGTTGILWTGDPYAAEGSLVLATMSPYSWTDVIVNYTTRTNRTLTPTPNAGGGFSFPGTAFAVNRSGSRFVYTPGDFGGDGVAYTYGGGDIVMPFTNVADFPRIANVSMVNLLLPASSLGYPNGAALWLDRSWTRDGTVIAGMTAVSAYVNNPPQARYLYVANLSSGTYANSSRPSSIPPLKQIPWNAPIGVGHFFQVSSNILLHIPWAPSTNQWVLFDETNNTWKNYSVPGWNVVWSGHVGAYLYLLIETSWSNNVYTFMLDRIDTSPLTKLASVTTMPVTTLFNATFAGGVLNYYVEPIVRGTEMDFLAGTGGYMPVYGPEVFSLRAFNWTTGAALYNATLNAPLPASSWVMAAEYPSPRAELVFGAGILDFDGNRIIPLNSTTLRAFADGKTGTPPCAQCPYAFWVTAVNATAVSVAGLREDYVNRTTALFSLRVLFDHRPPVAVFTVSPGVGNATTTFTVNASGVSSPYQPASTLQVRWDWQSDGTWDTNWTTAKTAQHRFPADSRYSIAMEVRDGLGVTNGTARNVTVDGTPPATTSNVLGAAGQAGWYTSAVTVVLAASDAVSGVASLSVQLDGGPATTTAANASVPIGDGRHTLAFHATDRAGNVEPTHTLAVDVDTDRPRISGLGPSGTVTVADVGFTWTATDNTSGVGPSYVSVDDAAYVPAGNGSATVHLADGTHTVRVAVFDAAGNSITAAVTVRVDTYVFSFTGPYAGIPFVLLIGGIAVAPVLLFLLSERLRRRRRT